MHVPALTNNGGLLETRRPSRKLEAEVRTKFKFDINMHVLYGIYTQFSVLPCTSQHLSVFKSLASAANGKMLK